MTDLMTPEMLAMAKKLAVECAPGKVKQDSYRAPAWMLSASQIADLRLAHDEFGIYAERRALGRVLPGGVAVYRGDEWFHV